MRRAFVVLVTLLVAATATAQRRSGATPPPPSTSIPCTGMIGVPLPPIPEIRSANGVLRGTLYTVSEQVMMPGPPAPGSSDPTCVPQWVRAYRRDAPSSWNPPSSELLLPTPGPTLRAKLGDVVTLTFLNVIDANKFPGADDKQCDDTGVYPGKPPLPPNPDTFPDCFAGSVITNVHYHGSHVSPSSTADNVFLQIKPSPRKHDGTNAPVIDEQSVKELFGEFYAACEEQLRTDVGPKTWPRIWSDLPTALQGKLTDWVSHHAPKEWAQTNRNLIATGNWPQYFVGAYPYCFRIPRYTRAEWPPAPRAALRTPHTHGAGVGEVDEAKAPARPLVMGQAPGTHWYHAHKHGSTTINVMNGMTGAFIIEGQYDEDVNRFYGADWTRRQPLLVVNQLGSTIPLMTNQKGGPGPAFTVNARIQPTIAMKGNEVQMWRIVNSSGRAGIYFTAPQGLQWKQLAQDGVQFNRANYASRTNHEFQLASGNRADLLVKAPPYDDAPGATNRYPVLVYNTVDPSDRPPQKPSAAQLTLLTVVVEREKGPDMQFLPEAPAFPPFLADIADAEITGTKVLTFASTPLEEANFPMKGPQSQHTIDGKKFDGELGAVVELNRVEEWKIVNETYPPANVNQISHPFHIHLNPFQVTEVFDPNEPLSHAKGVGTVTIENGATVTGSNTKFASTFRPGDFLWIDGGTSGVAPPAAIVTRVESDTKLQVNLKYVLPNGVTKIERLQYTSAVPRYTVDAKSPRKGQCVLEPDDPSTWKPCHDTAPKKDRVWWDVFPIPSGNIFRIKDGAEERAVKVPGWFRMRSRFVDFSGYFVLHCHILAHEDRGMMTVVQIAPLQTPYSHH